MIVYSDDIHCESAVCGRRARQGGIKLLIEPITTRDVPVPPAAYEAGFEIMRDSASSNLY